MTGRTQDDAFHEIQLNGKQLVFLFMAATVVSVVIFLCGVLVGRGVRSARASAEETMAVGEGPTAVALSTPSTSDALPEQVIAPGSDPRTAAAPPPEVDDLTFFSRLEEANPPVEKLKPAKPAPAAAPVPAPAAAPKPAAAPASMPAPATAPIPAPAVAPKPQPAAPAPPTATGPVARESAPSIPPPRPAATAAPAAPAAPKPTVQPAAPVQSAPAALGDWAVQIAALNVQSEAEAVAKRLASKGYTAYVVTPGNGTPAVYRVRIGPFKTRREADTIAVKLEKEEQFKPWVTR